MKQHKGFAAMTEEQKKSIASAGGRAAHAKGKAYRFNSETAKQAGRKGGLSVSKNKDHMSNIGQKGGLARSRNIGANRINDIITKYESTQKAENTEDKKTA